MFATAPYYSGERSTDPDFATDSVTTVLGKMLTIDVPDCIDAFERSAVIAAARGLPLGTYEAGQHLFYWDSEATAIQDKLTAINRHVDMYDVQSS